MNSTVSHPEQALQALEAQIEEARRRLDGHSKDLRVIDGELAKLSVQRQQHELVDAVCVSLERLGELGGAELFWGDRVPADKSGEYIRHIRSRGDSFRQQLREIDGRRAAVVEKIRHEQEVLAFLEDDLYDAQQQEERRKLEWMVEREISAVAQRPEVMPWTRGGEDDRRFRKSLATSLVACLLFGLLMPLIDLPLPEPDEPLEVPERLVSLVRQQQVKAVLPPTPREVKPEPTEPEPPPEPKPVEKPEPTTEVPTLAEVPATQPSPGPAAPEPAPEPKVEKKGLLAFRDNLSNLAESRPSARLGSDARISGAGANAVGRTERSMVSTPGPGSSGGINLASLSRDVGGGGAGGQIGGVAVTQAASSIGGITGGDRPLSGGPSMGRTDEEIQIVFDRHKAALYRLYNRELRKDPTLRGQMVLRLTIEADGTVSLCQLQASDMNAPELSVQIVDRVRTFDFGAKDGISAITILYPIDFLPAV